MKGADEYANLFETGQYGRLYICSHYHARGKTFRIFVLPEGVVAKPNGPNAPLNNDAVEVYGVVTGQRGWSEVYGWLHRGKWEQDFDELVRLRRATIAAEAEKQKKAKADAELAEKQRVNALLASY